jgi:hypothetical protein
VAEHRAHAHDAHEQSLPAPSDVYTMHTCACAFLRVANRQRAVSSSCPNPRTISLDSNTNTAASTVSAPANPCTQQLHLHANIYHRERPRALLALSCLQQLCQQGPAKQRLRATATSLLCHPQSLSCISVTHGVRPNDTLTTPLSWYTMHRFKHRCCTRLQATCQGSRLHSAMARHRRPASCTMWHAS